MTRTRSRSRSEGLVFEYPTTSLYHQYPGEASPQPCYVRIDPVGRRVWADWSAVRGNNITDVAVRRQLVIHFDVEWPLTVTGWRLLFQRIRPLAQRLVDGWRLESVGDHDYGCLNRDAQEAYQEIVGLIEDIVRSFAADENGEPLR